MAGAAGSTRNDGGPDTAPLLPSSSSYYSRPSPAPLRRHSRGGRDVLQQLFCLEPDKLDEMMEVAVVEKAEWKGGE